MLTIANMMKIGLSNCLAIVILNGHTPHWFDGTMIIIIIAVLIYGTFFRRTK
jgi:hypothetical protein